MTRSSAPVPMKQNTTNSFGANLKALRKKAGLTQEELADRLGVANKTISNWELGNSIPTVDDVKKLADALHVSEQQLLSPDNEASRWVLSIKVVPDFDVEEVISMHKGTPNVSDLNLHKDGATLVLSGSYEMWTNKDNLQNLIEQLQKAAGLITHSGKAMGNIKN